LDTVELIPQGNKLVLRSSIELISNIKEIPTGETIETLIKAPIASDSQSVHDVLVTGLVEICKVKPVGLDAVQWLGEWLIANNPNTPQVEIPDE
jgi:Dpy-30 motif